MNKLIDQFARPIQYLRLSITDRCNLRCVYCEAEEEFMEKPREQILHLEELARFAKIAVALGINKVRVTGGEPLVRRNVVRLIEQLAAIPGLQDLSLTTNGALLAPLAAELKRAGLQRINIHLDSLNPTTYARTTCGHDVAPVLAGIDAALVQGLHPVKINVVVHAGTIDELEDFEKLAHEKPVHVRFIEEMDLPYQRASRAGKGWTENILRLVKAHGYEPSSSLLGFGPARTFAKPGDAGTLGIIHNLDGHHCARCNRLRLTADGRIKPCLFSGRVLNVFPLLRENAPAEAIAEMIRAAVADKPENGLTSLEPEWRRMREIGG